MKSFQNSYSASVMDSVSQQQGPKKTEREETLIMGSLNKSSNDFWEVLVFAKLWRIATFAEYSI